MFCVAGVVCSLKSGANNVEPARNTRSPPSNAPQSGVSELVILVIIVPEPAAVDDFSKVSYNFV